MTEENNTFDSAQQHLFQEMRDNYRRDDQYFTNPELEKLMFLRWLYQNSRFDHTGTDRSARHRKLRVAR